MSATNKELTPLANVKPDSAKERIIHIKGSSVVVLDPADVDVDVVAAAAFFVLTGDCFLATLAFFLAGSPLSSSSASSSAAYSSWAAEPPAPWTISLQASCRAFVDGSTFGFKVERDFQVFLAGEVTKKFFLDRL